jgi:hypothetical protein
MERAASSGGARKKRSLSALTEFTLLLQVAGHEVQCARMAGAADGGCTGYHAYF